MTPPKLQLLTSSDEEVVSWRVFGPKRLFRLPRSRRRAIPFQFIVQNKAPNSCRVKVQVESPSPILIFRRAKSKRMSKTRLYAKITTLGQSSEQRIPPDMEATYDFLADYTPHKAPRLPSELSFFFGIFVYDDEGVIQTRFGPRKITLPITCEGSPEPPVDDYFV